MYLPPKVNTGAPLAGAQDFSIDRILAADSSNIRRTLGAIAFKAGADRVSTIPRNFNLCTKSYWSIAFRGAQFLVHIVGFAAGGLVLAKLVK